MRKSFFLLCFFLLCFFKGHTFDLIEKEEERHQKKITIEGSYGGLYHIGETRSFASFSETLKFTYKNPWEIGVYLTAKPNKKHHEFGFFFTQKMGETNQNGGNVYCNNQIQYITVKYRASFNYLSLHYGRVYTLLKKNWLSQTIFFRAGTSFVSSFEKVVAPSDCGDSGASGSDLPQKSILLEIGTRFNITLLNKDHFGLVLKPRFSWRALEPQSDFFVGLGIGVEFN